MLNCNKKTFGMVIKNLTENAIKFNDKDLLKIDIKVKKVRQNAVISFSDNGPGIPPEESGMIFQKFYQVE